METKELVKKAAIAWGAFILSVFATSLLGDKAVSMGWDFLSNVCGVLFLGEVITYFACVAILYTKARAWDISEEP